MNILQLKEIIDRIIDRKEDIKKWFEIKSESKEKYDKILDDMGISLDENLCVINFRIQNLISQEEAFRDSG